MRSSQGEQNNGSQCAQTQLYRIVLHNKDGMDPKRSKHDSVAPTCREEFHRHSVAAMVQEVDVAALAGENAKRIVPQITGALSVDELASQLVSKQREHLTATLATARITELIGDVAATDTAST